MLGIVICVSSFGNSLANENKVEVLVDGRQTSEDLSGDIDYLLDEEWNKTVQDMLGNHAHEFKPIPAREPDFGYIDSRVWLRIRTHNVTIDKEDWRVYVRENFLQYYDVYLVRENGDIEHLESHNRDTTFSERSTNFPELVTQFDFAPGERITLFISYWSGGSSHAAVTLETAESFASIAVNRVSKTYISYGMMAILIFASLFGLAILRLPVFLAYLSYVVVTLFYLMHQDGVAFQFLWPEFPRFNSYFSIVVGTFFVMATYNFARVFLQTANFHPKLDKFMKFMFWLTPVLTICGAFIDPQRTKQSIFILVFIAISTGIFGGLLAARTRFKQVRFYLFAWFVGGIGAAGLMNLRHIFGMDIDQDMVFDSVRVSIVIDALMMGLSIADHYIQILRSRQKATAVSLSEAKQNLTLNNRLFALEEQFKLASELSMTRDQSMRHVIHDLRQPLYALRLNLGTLRDKDPNQTIDIGKIDQNFDYLESLIQEQLQKSVTEDQTFTQSEIPKPGLTSDLSLNRVLQSIHEMFLPDATEKDLEFTCMPTRQNTDVDPLVIMRIVSNLVSNAIKYTSKGKVLLGVRRAGNTLRVEVHDTGAGLTQSEFERAQGREIRLHEGNFGVGGQGLGLNIVSDLVQKNNLNLYVHPRRKNGTGVILDIPGT